MDSRLRGKDKGFGTRCVTSVINIPSLAMLPSDYLVSRDTFNQLAARLGVASRCFVHEEEGKGNPVLSTDVAYLGQKDAQTLVIVASGTHGVEGYAGAACQFRFMETFRDRFAHSGIAYLLVHAVNPWGFLHDRRVTREGIDLNRNFIDFPAPDHARVAYDAYHCLLVSDFQPMPRGLWNEREREWARRKMKNAFSAVDAEWYDQVVARFDQVMEQLARGLA